MRPTWSDQVRTKAGIMQWPTELSSIRGPALIWSQAHSTISLHHGEKQSNTGSVLTKETVKKALYLEPAWQTEVPPTSTCLMCPWGTPQSQLARRQHSIWLQHRFPSQPNTLATGLIQAWAKREVRASMKRLSTTLIGLTTRCIQPG